MNMKPWLTAAATVAVCLVEVHAEGAQPDPAPPEPAPAPAPEAAPPEPRAEPKKDEKSEVDGAGLAIGAPEAPTSEGGEKLTIRPYLLLSAGLKYDTVYDRPEEDKQNRLSTFAMSRFGLKARWGDWIGAESEFMASGGIGLHGTSTYEGQAALQVRQQVIRLGRGVWRFEAGRLFDEASIDFFSAHVADTFLQDTATRDPLLFSGFNLGNGLRGTLEVVPGLRIGLTFNASNPVSTTSSLMVGGSYPPFERFYTQPYQAVNQGPNHFPDDTFHMYVVTPSVLVDTKVVDARFAVQGFDVDTDMNRSDNDHLRGYNARGTARLKLFDGIVVPFASGAYTRNDTLEPTDLGKRAKDRYQAVNVGGGVDFDWARRFKCAYDCADGIGIQYQQVQYQVGDGLVTTNRYGNLGLTYWLAPNVSVGARFAVWQNHPEDSAMTGERSGIVSMRLMME